MHRQYVCEVSLHALLLIHQMALAACVSGNLCAGHATLSASPTVADYMNSLLLILLVFSPSLPLA